MCPKRVAAVIASAVDGSSKRTNSMFEIADVVPGQVLTLGLFMIRFRMLVDSIDPFSQTTQLLFLGEKHVLVAGEMPIFFLIANVGLEQISGMERQPNCSI